MSRSPSNLTRADIEALMNQQGDEIRRLTGELGRAEALNKSLQEDMTALKVAQADLTSRLNGARALINEHNLQTDDYRPYRPLRTPIYKKATITPFHTGTKIPAAYLHKAASALSMAPRQTRLRLQTRPPAKRALVRLGDETQWDASYDTCTVLRADVQRMPDGQWCAASAHAQFARVHHVVARLDGRAFYMGEFKCQHRRSVDVAAFKRLSREMQCAVLARVDTNQTTREESATMLRNGGVPLTQLTLRRVGYDERFQAALLKVHARFGPSARDEDVEDFEEDCDEEK